MRIDLAVEVSVGETRRSFRIRECSRGGDDLRVCLEGIDDRDAAAALTGATVRVSRNDLAKPRAGEFFDIDLIGLEVVTTTGEALGSIVEVIETGANDVYVVDGERGECLVPAVEHAVVAVDLAERRMTVIAEAVEYSAKQTSPHEPTSTR